MGRARVALKPKRRSNPYRQPPRCPLSQGTSGKKKPKSKLRNSRPHPATKIPFQPIDRILLVGEGDFSFSQSLLTAHHCTKLDATTLDNHSDLISKYPQAESNMKCLTDHGCTVICGVNATKLGKVAVSGNGGKKVRKGNYDWVVFNFPHVGGLTKDVNRQVRHNQGK